VSALWDAYSKTYFNFFATIEKVKHGVLFPDLCDSHSKSIGKQNFYKKFSNGSNPSMSHGGI